MSDSKAASTLLFGTAALAALGFAALTRAVARGQTKRWDRRAKRAVHAARARVGEHALSALAHSTTPLGKWWSYVPAAFATALKLRENGRNAAAIAVAGTSVAALKGLDVDKQRERENVLVVYNDIVKTLSQNGMPQPIVFDPAKATGFPKNWVVSDRAAITWSDDNARVYFGTKAQVPVPDTRRRSTDEVANVDVWNTGDERIQSQQMIRADDGRQCRNDVGGR